MKSVLTSLLSVLLISTPSLAQVNMECRMADNARMREHNVNMLSMKLDVSFVPEKKLAKGKVSYQFKALQQTVDTVYLDGPAISILSATLDGKNIKTKSSAAGITLYFDTPVKYGSGEHNITLTYEATPRKGIYFIGWDDPNNLSKKQIWTQGQGIDNRHWIPSYDEPNDKLTTEINVTFDSKYKVLSNGKKIMEKKNKNGTTSWQYRMTHPHPSYLVMLGIGVYDISTVKSKSGVLIHNYYYPELAERVESTYAYSAFMMDLLEDETGLKYPWEQYSQIPVQDFLYGAMENTTATIFGDFSMVDKNAYLDYNYVGTNMHELAHQWFGNYITAWSHNHNWLQESFATYYPKVMTKSLFGKDQHQWDDYNDMQTALATSKTNKVPVVNSGAGTSRIYQKGSVVLGMMRNVVGDEEFKRGIKHYLHKFPYHNVETNDLLVAFHEELGVNLDWFFEQWLYRGGEPEYTVSYDAITEGDNSKYTAVRVSQTHTKDALVQLFKMPMYISVNYADGTSDRQQYMIEKETHVIKIPNTGSKRVDFVVFDSGNRVLKELIFERSTEALLAQALRAGEMIDRYEAVRALRKTPAAEKRAAFESRFDKESFHSIRAEMASQLAADDNEISARMLLRAMADSHATVRNAAARSIPTVGAGNKAGFVKMLSDSSYRAREIAFTKLVNQYPDECDSFIKLLGKQEGMSKSIRIKILEQQALRNSENAMKELVSYTSNSYEFRTRINAMSALQRLNYLDREAIDNLFNASLNYNNRLNDAASACLNSFRQQTEFKLAIDLALIETKMFDENQKKTLQTLLK